MDAEIMGAYRSDLAVGAVFPYPDFDKGEANLKDIQVGRAGKSTVSDRPQKLR